MNHITISKNMDESCSLMQAFCAYIYFNSSLHFKQKQLKVIYHLLNKSYGVVGKSLPVFIFTIHCTVFVCCQGWRATCAFPVPSSCPCWPTTSPSWRADHHRPALSVTVNRINTDHPPALTVTVNAIHSDHH